MSLEYDFADWFRHSKVFDFRMRDTFDAVTLYIPRMKRYMEVAVFLDRAREVLPEKVSFSIPETIQ